MSQQAQAIQKFKFRRTNYLIRSYKWQRNTIELQPLYPRAAKALGAKDVVEVQVELDEAGNVVSASAIDGHPLLKDAAETAVTTMLNSQRPA
ncbi:MAG: energy transducer TonB [Pyrinomonadaceae bacterium]